MPNYNESAVTGTSWTRSNYVELHNPLNGIPSIEFREEDVYNVGNEIIHRARGISAINPLKEYLANPETVFDLLHPETDAVIGTAHYQDIYVMLYSLYRKLTAARDLAANPPA